jgi:formylglycine-generating enzyme required for sulfatase activity/pimeloyl-ACP methyl ester carboxylesterase
MRSIVKFAIVCLFLCPGLAARAADKDYSKDVEVSTDVVYGHKFALAMTMDVLRPRKNANGAGIVLIVSGAWHSVVFPPESAFSSAYPYSAWFDCRALFDKGFTLFIVRHGSGERFLLPEIVDDVRRSIRFIRYNAQKYGVDPDRLGSIGASAGGHLSMMLATTSDEGVPNPKNWDGMLRIPDRVAAAVAYYPPTDIRSWFVNGHAKDYEAFRFDPKLAPENSPLLWVTPQSAPALMVHGDKDTGVPYWHSEKMLAEYKKNNVPADLLTIKGVGHGFDIGFKGFDQYTPEQMKIMALARDTSVAWFEKYLLAPKKEVKAAQKAAPASAPKVNLSHEYAVVDLSAGPAGPWPVTELDKAPDDLLKNDAWRTTKLVLRRIPAGKFVMGTPAGDAAGELYAREYHAEDKQHTVTLTKAFYMGVFPVTQDQWSRVMGNDPSYFAGNPKRPVETVSWNEIRGGAWPAGDAEAKTFIGRFRTGSSQAADLPTEAQWEYACRAGTTRALNDPAANLPAKTSGEKMAGKGEGADCTDANLAAIAWFEGNSQRQTHDVGLKAANAWGLYDMCGNVSQWCLDWLGDYSGDATDPVGPPADKCHAGHMLRGGYWSMDAPGCRSAARNYDASPPQEHGNVRYNVCGFRLTLETE